MFKRFFNAVTSKTDGKAPRVLVGLSIGAFIGLALTLVLGGVAPSLVAVFPWPFPVCVVIGGVAFFRV